LEAAIYTWRNKRVEHAANVATIVDELRLSGISTPQAIAEVLNARGILTVAGKTWTLIEVMRLDKRPKVRNTPLQRADWKPRKARPGGSPIE
jgi:hypothetical protein